MAPFGNVVRIKGDAFTLLKEEHRQIKDLFDEFESAPDIVSKQQIAEHVLGRLMIHAEVEEQVFYPAVRETLATEEMNALLDEALGQHHSVQHMMDELQRMVPTDREYEGKLRALAESVKQHIAEEEHDIFPRALEGAVNWEHVGAQMQITKVALRGRMGDSSGRLSHGESGAVARPLRKRHGK